MNRPVDYRNIASMIESWHFIEYNYLTKPNLVQLFASSAVHRDIVMNTVFDSYAHMSTLFVKLIHGTPTK